MKEYWHIIGYIAVDSGTIAISDPCYFLPMDDDPDHKPNVTYQSLFEHYFDGDYGKRVLGKEFLMSGIGGSAVVFNTHSGDGSYPAIALVEENEKGYKSIKRVVIDTDYSFYEELVKAGKLPDTEGILENE